MSRGGELLRGLVLVLAVGVAYAVAVDAPFTYDDRIEVIGNRTIRSPSEWAAIAGYHPNRPVLIATYAANWAWGGFDPTSYHLVSFAIHALNALLAWRLATRLLDAERALYVAAVWGLHPMCTEAVTYVTGRSDALSGTFWLLALIGWIDHRRGRRGPGLTLGAALAALLTKEIAVLLPLALWATSRFALADRVAWRRWLPFAGGVALIVALRVGLWGWPAPEVPRSLVAQVLSQAEAWCVYLRLWLFPVGQSVLHDWPGEARALGVAALVGWVLAVGVLARRGGLPAVGFALAAAWLLPSSLVPLKEVLAEHRSYLAGLGFVLALVGGLPWHRAAWVLVPVLAAGTVARNLEWTDEPTLWRGATEQNPGSFEAWYGYGDALRFAQRHAEAEAAFDRALELRPDDVNALVNRGICEVQQDRPEEARATWQRALRADPRSCSAHNNLAALDLRSDALPAAAAGYASTLYWCPGDLVALRALGGIYEEMGDYRRAAEMLRRYAELAPPGTERDDAERRLRRIAP